MLDNKLIEKLDKMGYSGIGHSIQDFIDECAFFGKVRVKEIDNEFIGSIYQGKSLGWEELSKGKDRVEAYANLWIELNK